MPLNPMEEPIKFESLGELKSLKVTRNAGGFAGVILVELNRPKRLKAMDVALFEEIPKIFNSLNCDVDARVVVLAGLGKGVCSGLDLGLLMQIGEKTKECEDPSRAGLFNLEFVKWLQNGISAIEQCRLPVIAAAHGMCVGGGVDLFTATDIRICSEQTTFSVREVFFQQLSKRPLKRKYFFRPFKGMSRNKKEA